jgi:2-keto-4-pentenoate hydratase/2-oxohepta-3-ene-1,7-dioic acid hydratase in catechol pathway
MKLATFRKAGAERVGIVHGGDARVFDLAAAAERASAANPAFASMLSLIDGGEAALDAARAMFDRRKGESDLSSDVGATEILSPLPEPRQMRDAMSFPLHILQAPRGQLKLAARQKGDTAELARIDAMPLGELPAVYRNIPIFYITNRFSVRGTNTTVKWPRYSKVMDYELEFGVVTKNRGANISAAKAKDHIFGYTIFNDFSARDAQRVEMEGRLGPAKGKSFDGGNVLGPWIVTPDEIGDPYRLKMEARINGEVRCSSTSEGMLFSFEEIMEHISKDETLMPGEFIGSGTVGGGCGTEIGLYLEHGDTIELEVEKIGVLRNRVERQS